MRLTSRNATMQVSVYIIYTQINTLINFKHFCQANNTLLELANAKLSNIEVGMSLIAASASMQPVGTASTHQEAPVSMTPIPVAPVPSNNIAVSAGADYARHELVSSTPARSSSAALPLRSLVLANGNRVEFTAADVPPPPSMSFAHDIPLINSMWDDTSLHWGNYSVLNICGVYIPIIYWKKVYSRCPNGGGSAWKPKQWQSIKNNYSKWKVSILTISSTSQTNSLSILN